MEFRPGYWSRLLVIMYCLPLNQNYFLPVVQILYLTVCNSILTKM